MGGEEIHRSDTETTAAVEKVSSPSPTTYLPALLEDDEDVVEGLEEEKVASMMRWLEREISFPPSPAAVREGNHECCVPSLSHPASTVKDAVDITGSVGGTSHGAAAGGGDEVLTEVQEERSCQCPNKKKQRQAADEVAGSAANRENWERRKRASL